MVEDSGVGIAPENLSHVLEAFGQVRTGTQTGTGLGLPLAKAMVEAHGGRLDISSQRGVGTRISVNVELPCRYPKREQTALYTAAVTAAPNSLSSPQHSSSSSSESDPAIALSKEFVDVLRSSARTWCRSVSRLSPCLWATRSLSRLPLP